MIKPGNKTRIRLHGEFMWAEMVADVRGAELPAPYLVKLLNTPYLHHDSGASSGDYVLAQPDTTQVLPRDPTRLEFSQEPVYPRDLAKLARILARQVSNAKLVVRGQDDMVVTVTIKDRAITKVTTRPFLALAAMPHGRPALN